MFCGTSIAQDPQLFEDTWYLQKLTISGDEFLAPSIMPEITEHIFDEMDSIFSTGYCDALICELSFDITNDSFDILSVTELGIGCNNQEDVTFHVLYYDYLEEHLQFNPYSYEITNSNDIRYLELTNANGNKALYANQLLAAPEQTIFFVSIYPNPAKDSLTISLKSIDNASVTVYNILGVAVLDTTITSTSNTLNMETLSSGVYLISVTANDGRKQTLKLIKE
jgi:hypothetical protein